MMNGEFLMGDDMCPKDDQALPQSLIPGIPKIK